MVLSVPALNDVCSKIEVRWRKHNGTDRLRPQQKSWSLKWLDITSFHIIYFIFRQASPCTCPRPYVWERLKPQLKLQIRTSYVDLGIICCQGLFSWVNRYPKPRQSIIRRRWKIQGRCRPSFLPSQVQQGCKLNYCAILSILAPWEARLQKHQAQPDLNRTYTEETCAKFCKTSVISAEERLGCKGPRSS